jgi:hypothetical protein
MRLRFVAPFVLALATPSCESGGVGDPCVPEDEYQKYFSGYELGEVDFETRSFQCETRICLVNHFQGRTSCPYGQSFSSAEAATCHLPGSSDAASAIRVDVRPQLTNRRATDAVYCSCRCGGTDPAGRYCRCPTGFTCTELLRDIGVGSAELAGSYCIKAGTEYRTFDFAPGPPCESAQHNCGHEDGS